MRVLLTAILILAALLGTSRTPASQGVHYTYLWHLEQPIYWPAPDATGLQYERAWESIQSKLAGAIHPENDLETIFSKDDRVAAYQWRPKDSVQTLLGYDEAGAQVSYSGGLVENVISLGEAGQLGYSTSWNAGFKEAQGWATSQGTPRLDVVIFPFHHPLLPLTDDRVIAMEIALYKELYGEVWDSSKLSKGMFPSEMAFSERIIPELVKGGIEWVVVSNSHLSRACEDYPFVAGSGGDNIPPPNPADALNPAQGTYNRVFIDRGVSPANAYPFAYRPHYARYVDPSTGEEYKIIVVPAAQSESWKDGYSCYGLDEADEYAASSEAEHPILVLMAHDGDNAFGGGYDYYMSCVPTLASSAAGKGYIPSTVAGYLADHPVDEADVVHVEDGAWVNADGDFGAPTFWNWSWPPMGDDGVDIAEGWAEDQRNFAVIMAATNYVLTAQDMSGIFDVQGVLHPDAPGTTAAERAWHFLLGALNSGYMYYGKALDMELKPTVACNAAISWAKDAVATFVGETTPPTMFVPQHYPDNPGGENFGPLYDYQLQTLPSDTWFWTFAFDVSGMDAVTLMYRVDGDGVNDMATDDNELYAGGADVGEWQSLPMTLRVFPKGNVTDDPDIDDSILPDYIADEYYVVLTGVEDSLVDYYVEATDALGNVARSPIQHLWIGSGGGVTPTPDGPWLPEVPDCDDEITIYADADGWLHWGVDGWTAPDESLWPAGTTAFGEDGQAVETPLEPCAEGYCAVIGPLGETIGTVDFVFHFTDETWDNNSGQDYHLPITPCGVVTEGDVEVIEETAGEVVTADDAMEGDDTTSADDSGGAEVHPGHDATAGDTTPGSDTATSGETTSGIDTVTGGATSGTSGDEGGCSSRPGTSAGPWGGILLLTVALSLLWRRRRGRARASWSAPLDD